MRFDIRVSTMASSLNLLNQVFCFAFKINSKYNFIKTLFDAELSTPPNQLVNYSKPSLGINLYSRLYYNSFIYSHSSKLKKKKHLKTKPS